MKKNRKKWLKRIMWVIVVLIVLNLLLPSKIQNPVEGCGKESYNKESFWHPWGDHKHRGIDIFAKKGTPVHPAIGGIVVAAMHTKGAGGNIVLVFSSKLRFHYYAHMSEIDTHVGAIVTKKSVIGKVGDTGNAAGKSPHLHYSISTIYPQGEGQWDPKKHLFFINPIKELE
ncbi:MAG: M23 family metallopeptidase [Prevotella sp.]|nr:M23 family metallopeptidase [Prevotella sp.]